MIRNPYAKQPVKVSSVARPNIVATVQLTESTTAGTVQNKPHQQQLLQLPTVGTSVAVARTSNNNYPSTNCSKSNNYTNQRVPQQQHHQQQQQQQQQQHADVRILSQQSKQPAQSRNDIPIQHNNNSNHTLLNGNVKLSSQHQQQQCVAPLSQQQQHQQLKPPPPSTVALSLSSSAVASSTTTSIRPPSSSSTSSATTIRSGIHNNQATTTSTTTTTTTLMLERYYNTLPPEIRFPSNIDITKPIQDEYRINLIKNATLSEPLLNGWTLYSHQKRAILVSLLMRRHILALDMGLGKTVIGCCWARAFARTIPKLQIVIICPVSLKEEWYRTAHDVTGLSIRNDHEINPQPKKKKKRKNQIDLTTDDNDIDDFDTTDGVVTIHSWAKIPTPDEIYTTTSRNQPYVVIADEAHSMQSMNSARTRDALHLMLSPNAVGVLLLTGTPMKNGKPANLFPLLKAVKHPFGNHQRAYEAQFCGGRDMSNGIGRPLWVATGATNLDQLRVLTKSHMLHMTKDECLKELPKQTRYKKTVFVSSRSQMKHNDAMNKLSLLYSNRQDPLQQEAILGAVQNIRLVDSFAKVTATVEVAREVLRKEAAVVIFTSFVDVAKLVHEKLNEYGWTGELLTGETPPKKRQGMVDNFQNGLSPVFCCTFGAGGVGLTLTAASTVILLDRPWTPGDVHQAEDRVRRIGQTKPVTSIWMSAFELDKQIDEMIESKSQTSTTVLSEQSTSGLNNNNTTSKLSIMKMVHSFLSNQSSASTNNTGLKQATLPEYGHGNSRSY